MTIRHIPPRPDGHNPFKVPENYFEDFQTKMMARISRTAMLATHASKVKEMPVIKWIPLLGAACVAALAVIFTVAAPIAEDELTGAVAVEQEQNATFDDSAYDYLVITDSETLAAYDSDY